MKDFILAAAPWVLCGISIALLAAKGASKEKLSAGASVIMLLGTALGAAFASLLGMSTGLGMGIGMLAGTVLGLLTQKSKS